MTTFYVQLLWVALGVLALLIFCCIIRAVIGPRVADRLVAVNMMTTLVTVGICVLTFLLAEGYLADVALIFSLLGFLAVVVLTRVFLSLAKEKEVQGQNSREMEAGFSGTHSSLNADSGMNSGRKSSMGKGAAGHVD